MSLADALVELQELTERLRRECPWDREQTARTIVRTPSRRRTRSRTPRSPATTRSCSTRSATSSSSASSFRCCWRSTASGDIESAARGIHAKLDARHPHVFGDAEARTPPRVRDRWEEIKRERGGPRGDLPRRARGPARAARTRARCSSVRSRSASSTPTSPERSPTSTTSCASSAPSCRRDPPGDRARARGSPRSSATCFRRRQRRAPAERRPGARAARGDEAVPRPRRNAPRRLRPPMEELDRGPRSTSRTPTTTRQKEQGDERSLRCTDGRCRLRGNPTVEVDVRLESGALGSRDRPVGRVDRRPRGGRAARRRREWGGKGVTQAVAQRERRDRRGAARPRRRRPGGARPRADRARRHAEEGAARRERDPRRLARSRQGGAADEGVSLFRYLGGDAATRCPSRC